MKEKIKEKEIKEEMKEKEVCVAGYIPLVCLFVYLCLYLYSAGVWMGEERKERTEIGGGGGGGLLGGKGQGEEWKEGKEKDGCKGWDREG